MTIPDLLSAGAAMTTTDVILGFDPSKTKMGWGAVHDDDGRPVTAGAFDLDGSPEDVADTIAAIDILLDGRGLTPVLAYIEYPFGGTQTRGSHIFEAGVALGYVEMAARTRWPDLPIDRILPGSWRPKVGVPHPPKGLTYQARKKWLKQADVQTAQVRGFELPIVGKRVLRPSDDAADGALIALAAWLDLEAGVARRLTA